MADPVLKFPPEAKDAPSGRPTKKLASEPRRRLLDQLDLIKENVRRAIQNPANEAPRKEPRYG